MDPTSIFATADLTASVVAPASNFVVALNALVAAVPENIAGMSFESSLMHNIKSTSIATWALMYSRSVITVFGQKA